MNPSDFKNIKLSAISSLKMPDISTSANLLNSIVHDMNRQTEQLNRDLQEKEEREEWYKESVLKALQGIEKNTGSLSEIAFLLKEGNVARDELYLMFERMFSILNAKNKDEAESIYRQVMKDVSDLNTGIDVMTKLSNFGSLIYNMMFPDS